MVDRTNVTVSTAAFELPDPDEDVPLFTKAQNLAKARRLLDVAGKRGSDIVCLPELFSTKRTADQNDPEDIPGGETSKMLSEAARKWRMYVVGCYYEKDGDKIHNSVALFDRAGEHVGTSHKAHLPPNEMEFVTPGDSFPVLETDFGKVGAIACFDVFFPEATRSLALAGAEMVFWPTMCSEESMSRVMARARAIENNIFMVSSNYSQKEGWHIGFSAVINRRGEILADTGRREGVATAVVNLDDKRYIPGAEGTGGWQGARRVEIYGQLLKKGKPGNTEGGALP